MKKVILTSLLLASTQTFAETYDLANRWGIGGGAGQSFPILGNRFDDQANNGFAWNAHARIQTSSANAWVFQYQQQEFQNTSIGAKVYDVTWLNRWRPVDRFSPIWGLGVGAADLTNIPPNASTRLALKGRLGMEYMMWRDVAVSLTADYQWIDKFPWNHGKYGQVGALHNIVGLFNVTVFFGHDREYRDNHPNTSAAPVAAAAMVPAMGDDDKDGVTNDKDKCPGTDEGAKVNGYGCVPEEKAHFEVNVFFPTGKATLDGNSHAALQDLASFMKENPETKVEIQGHTDNVGSAKVNKVLSQKRAEAVMKYLVEEMNIPSGRLSAYGYGKDRPVDSNATPEGREKNRRVMVEVTE